MDTPPKGLVSQGYMYNAMLRVLGILGFRELMFLVHPQGTSRIPSEPTRSTEGE